LVEPTCWNNGGGFVVFGCDGLSRMPGGEERVDVTAG
jgi:hypothetical protein